MTNDPLAIDLKRSASITMIALATLVTLGAFTPPGAFAESSDARGERGDAAEFPFRHGDMELGLSLGYAWGFKVGRSNPELEDVEMVSFAPRFGVTVGDSVGAGRWWEFGAQFFAQGEILWEVEPKSGSAFGGGLVIRVNWLAPRASTGLVPFLSVGGGVVSLNFDLIDQDDGLNYTPQLGAGVRYMIAERLSVEFEWRYHHISNADTRTPNHGINTNFFMLGASTYF